MLVIGLVIFGAVTAGVISDVFTGRSVGDASEVATMYGLLLLWLTLVWRFTMLGIWINDDAVRIRHITYTRTLPWASVAAIESREAMILSWARWQRSVWVIPTAGRPRRNSAADAQQRHARGLSPQVRRGAAVAAGGPSHAPPQRLKPA
jgi:hypothetical protein